MNQQMETSELVASSIVPGPARVYTEFKILEMELEELEQEDTSSDYLQTALGAFIGSLTAAGSFLLGISSGNKFVDYLTFAICTASLAVTIVIYLLTRKRATRRKATIARVRSNQI
jgi:hypothetical protein